MKLKILAVKDQKVQAFLQPFFMRTIGEGIRVFEQLCQDPQSKFSQNPEDFHLYEIGELEDTTGLIESSVEVMHLAHALDYVPKIPTDNVGTLNSRIDSLEEMIKNK